MLTIVDAFSKFANVIPLQTRTIIDLKKAITDHIRIFGRPKLIISDQDPAFVSIDFVGFLQDLNIKIHHASGSNSNGIVERFHSTFIELYRTLNRRYNNLEFFDKINVLVDIYNHAIHSVTGYRPRELIFNVQGKNDTDEILECFNKLQSNVKVRLQKQKE